MGIVSTVRVMLTREELTITPKNKLKTNKGQVLPKHYRDAFCDVVTIGEQFLFVSNVHQVFVFSFPQNAKAAMRDCAKQQGFVFSEEKETTHSLGRKLLKEYCGGQEIGQVGHYLIERLENGHIDIMLVYVEMDDLKKLAKHLKGFKWNVMLGDMYLIAKEMVSYVIEHPECVSVKIKTPSTTAKPSAKVKTSSPKIKTSAKTKAKTTTKAKAVSTSTAKTKRASAKAKAEAPVNAKVKTPVKSKSAAKSKAKPATKKAKTSKK